MYCIEDRLAEDIGAFDRLMSAHKSHLQVESRDESRDPAKTAVDVAKPDNCGHDDVELPLPHDQDKSRRLSGIYGRKQYGRRFTVTRLISPTISGWMACSSDSLIALLISVLCSVILHP